MSWIGALVTQLYAFVKTKLFTSDLFISLYINFTSIFEIWGMGDGGSARGRGREYLKGQNEIKIIRKRTQSLNF